MQLVQLVTGANEQVPKYLRTKHPCGHYQYVRFLAIAFSSTEKHENWVFPIWYFLTKQRPSQVVYLCTVLLPCIQIQLNIDEQDTMKRLQISRQFDVPTLHCCINLLNAVVSNAENSLTAASTASPSLMVSSLLCACMRM